jgi:hypothetical protein
LEILPESKPVLDKYHINKAIINCTGAQPEYRKVLWQVLKNADREEFKRTIKNISKKGQSENELKKIKEFRQYILNNWKGIENHKTENCGGSSAEAHVSHVLSARLSSRPMGWSREGLKYMSKLRAFYVNGGVVGVEHLRSKKEMSGLVKKTIERTQRTFQGINQQTLGNLVAVNMGKVTPLFRILRSIQQSGMVT